MERYFVQVPAKAQRRKEKPGSNFASLRLCGIRLPRRLAANFSKRCQAMKFPGGLNIQQMMKQAQVMQEKMQKEMEELRVEASAGGGVVTVQMKGNHELVALKIDPEAVKDGDVEMLQDMIVAATNEANRKVQEAMKGKLGGMLPPGLGNLF